MAEYYRRIEGLSWPPLNRTWRTTTSSRGSKRKKLLQASLAQQEEAAEPELGKALSPDSELRRGHRADTLTEEGSIAAFLKREVPDTWCVPNSVKISYEISVTRYFYEPQSLRRLAEIWVEIQALEQEGWGLLDEIIETSGHERTAV